MHKVNSIQLIILMILFKSKKILLLLILEIKIHPKVNHH